MVNYLMENIIKYSKEIQDQAKNLVYSMDEDERDLLLWIHLCDLIDQSTNDSSNKIDLERKHESIYNRMYNNLEN